MILNRRMLTPGDAVPVSTIYSKLQVPTPPSISTARQIPLWDQCGLNTNEICAGGAQCICKDPWWSQCRTFMNDSWTPLGEVWQCTGPKAGTAASYLSSSSAVVVQSTSTSRGSSASPSLPTLSSFGQTISTFDNSVPSNNISPSRASSYSRNVGSATPSSTSLSTVLSQRPISTPPPMSSSADHRTIINGSTKATTDSVAGPLTSQSFLAMASSSSSSASISISTTIQASHSAAVVGGLQQPTSTTIHPNLACPSPTAEDTSKPHTSDTAGFQACDPSIPLDSGNLSLTTNSSSSPNIPQTSNVDPDRSGSYC